MELTSVCERDRTIRLDRKSTARNGCATKTRASALAWAEILDVDVGAGSGVVGQIPAVVVGIVVDDDGIAVPVPVIGVVVIVGSYAEVEAAEPEAIAVSSAQMILMAAAKAAGEAAVFPGMIQVIVRVAAAGIVANPLVIVVHVRGVRMIGPIAEGAGVVLRAAFLSAIFRAAILLSVILGRAILRSVRRRTVLWNMATANLVSTTAALASVLRTSAAGWAKRSGGKREEQREQGG